MPSKKRLRPSSASDPGDDTNSGDKQRSKVSLTSGFLFLPAELQRIILELACFSPPSTAPPPPSQPGQQLLAQRDPATMFSLTLVCRQLRNHVSPHLWRTITITRPSSLFRLYQALVASPERAGLVDSLHIGPQDILPADWWPLRLGRRGIVSSLPQTRLPSGCSPGQVWPLDGSARGCQQVAVLDALQVAQECFDVDLLEDKLVPTEKVEAILMVQATLDLYLEKVKSIEEKKGTPIQHQSCQGQCRHYPTVVIGASTASAHSAPVPDGALRLERSQLLRHLARPGATTDRFDNPLLLARAGVRISVTTPSDNLRHRDGFCGAQYRLRQGHLDIAAREKQLWPDAELLTEEDNSPAPSGGSGGLNAALLSTGTLGAILRLTRDVLRITKRVKSLSLTGFLPHALDGHQLGPGVRRLSLGPPPSRWAATPPLTELKHIEELSLGGIPLDQVDIHNMLQNTPKLKRLQWSYVDKLPAKSFVAPLILQLAAEKRFCVVSQTGSSRSSHEEPSLVLITSLGLPSLEILVQLHPHDVAQVFNGVEPALRSAWREGRSPTPRMRPLMLREHPDATSDGSRPSQDSTSPIWIDLFREVEAWRQRGAS